MKALAIGDLHLDAGQHLSPSSAIRRQMVHDTLQDIVKTAPADIGIVRFLGDMFNTNKPEPQYIDILYKFVAAIHEKWPGAVMWWLTGQHDFNNGGCLPTVLASFLNHGINVQCVPPQSYQFDKLYMASKFRDLDKVEKDITVMYPDGVIMASYGCDLAPLQAVENPILYGHFGIAGVSVTESNYKMKSGVNLSDVAFARLAILGDIHKHQIISPSIFHLGVPFPMTIADVGPHYYAIVDESTATYKLFETSAVQIVALTEEAAYVNIDMYNTAKYIVVVTMDNLKNANDIRAKYDACHKIITKPRKTEATIAQEKTSIKPTTDYLGDYIHREYGDPRLLEMARKIVDEAGM